MVIGSGVMLLFASDLDSYLPSTGVLDQDGRCGFLLRGERQR